MLSPTTGLRAGAAPLTLAALGSSPSLQGVMDFGAAFEEVVAAVDASPDMPTGWASLQALSERQTGGRFLLADPPLDIGTAVPGLAAQVEGILASEPPSESLSFLYFGLFDVWDEESGRAEVGFYVSGGTGDDPVEEIASGDLPYFPDNRFLQSELLTHVYRLQGLHSEFEAYIGYALVFGVAALLVKHFAQQVGMPAQAFVGFDSGDFASVYPECRIA